MTRVATVALCSVIFAGTAAAQPGVCNVTIVRAPDGVREVVEGWLRGEPRCTGTLEVRIVPTDGGYYLFARDAAGRVRERVVPDPQSAGALIASWAADDAAPAPQPRPMAPPSLVAPTPMQDPFVDATPRALRTNHWGGWLTLGLVTSGTTTGLRAEGDVYSHGPIALGVAMSALEFDVPVAQYQNISGKDVRAIVYVTDTFHQGALSLRVGAGAGLMYTSSSAFDRLSGETMDYTDMVEPVGELQLEFGVDFGTRWSLTAGLVGTVFEQTWITDSQQVAEAKRYGDILAMLGARCRL
jgi:hypothetical protein